MRILHLSDLHFGIEKSKNKAIEDIDSRDNYMEELLDQVREIAEEKQIKYVFITGDIAYTAKKQEYEKASKWIRALINVCNIPASSVFICPGNHDVDRGELFDKEVPNSQKKANELLTTKYFSQISKRFEQYIEFCKELGVSSYKIGDDENYLVGAVTREDINVVCINTAWFAKSDEYEKNMWVGANFLERIKRDKLFANDLPTITIMHHPDNSWHEEERSNYDNNTNVYLEICKISNIVLYGHTHEVQNDYFYKEDAYICGSGAVFEDKVYHNNFHVYDIPDSNFSGYNCAKLIYKYSSKQWDKKEKGININLKNKCKNRTSRDNINISNKLEEDVMNTLEREISSEFIDQTVNEIKNDLSKIEILEDTMTYFIKKEDEVIRWDDIMMKMKKTAGNGKVGLSIQGFEGTGKSTFLSLLYLRLRQMRMDGNVERYPVFIDLHYYDCYSLQNAKEDLRGKLKFLDSMIDDKQIQLFLIFDGCDDYFRKNNELEKILEEYIRRNRERFVLCIGNANEVEKSKSKYWSPLHSFIGNNQLKLKSISINKASDIEAVLCNLSKVYCDKIDKDRINAILKSFKDTNISETDFRTLITCVRMGHSDVATSNLTIGSILYKYLLNVAGETTKLYDISRVSTIYTITEEKIDSDSFDLRGVEIIFKGKLIREYLIAYYFLETVSVPYEEDNEDYKRLCGMRFVFTPIINKFVKEMLKGKTVNEQNKIVDNLQKMYEYKNTSMSMKTQICYYLGRMDKTKPRNKASVFLEKEAVELERKIYHTDGYEYEQESQMTMVLYRTISVSLVLMENIKHTGEYINHLIYDDVLNSINRGFHMEYYSDKEYHLGESPDYFDDLSNPIDNTLTFLMGVIKGKLKDKNCTNICSIYLDIITLCSIFISRIGDHNVCEKYQDEIKKVADEVLKSVKILSPTVRSYVSMMKELMEHGKPYKYFSEEMYKLKSTERAGWVKRKISHPESIADHILGTVYLAKQFLPDNVNEFKEYKGIGDINKYEHIYDKKRIINMLLIHDMGEAYIGDKINKSEEDAKKENERFGYYAMLGTLPKLHGMNNNKEYWDEFFRQNTINAQIAYDIDKLEALIQANNYKKAGENIDLDEWIGSVRENVKTSLGEALLQFFIEEIIEE